MSKDFLEKYPLQSNYPIAYGVTSSNWKEVENRSVTLEGRNYSLITVERTNFTAAKICLAIAVTLFSLGLVLAFACGRQKVLDWWLGIERERFSLSLDERLPTPNNEQREEVSGSMKLPVKRKLNFVKECEEGDLSWCESESSEEDYTAVTG